MLYGEKLYLPIFITRIFIRIYALCDMWLLLLFSFHWNECIVIKDNNPAVTHYTLYVYEQT